MITAIDVSSHQPADISTFIEAIDPDAVIVKLYQSIEHITAEHNSQMAQAHSRDQIACARDHGKLVGGYWWPYHGQDLRAGLEEVLELAERCGGLDCAIPWADIEAYTDGSIPDSSEIAQLVEEHDRLAIQGGIYTSPEMWRRAGAPDPAFMWLWTASWDGRPTLEVPPYGGWTSEKIAGHQWATRPIDQSVFSDAVFAKPTSSPEPGQVEILTNRLGYLQGDVAKAIRGPLEDLKPHVRGRRSQMLLRSALDAVNTLETEGR